MTCFIKVSRAGGWTKLTQTLLLLPAGYGLPGGGVVGYTFDSETCPQTCQGVRVEDRGEDECVSILGRTVTDRNYSVTDRRVSVIAQYCAVQAI